MSDQSKNTGLSDDDLQDLVASNDTGARQPSNALVARVLVFVALAWSLFQLWYASPLPFMLGVFIVNDAEARAIHLGFAIFLGFMAFPALSKDPDGRVPMLAIALALLPALMFVAVVTGGERPVGELLFPLALVVAAGVLIVVGALGSSRSRISLADWAMALLGTYCATYGFLNYEALSDRPGLPTDLDIVVSATGLVLLLEATRRALGPPLMVVALLFLCYVFFGDAAWVPDVVKYQGASLNRAMSHMWLGPEGVFGIAIGVSAKFVFLFVLFGALLEKAGAGNYFIKVAFSLLGHLRGGPAKAAVVASGMTGLISGSSIANVVTTGVFTMPLMKRVGFTSEKAGAVEVASSVNGQIMPPVMGAAAFLMVEYVGIPYIDVVKHAFLPAVISYIALVYIVHLEAVKTGMQGLPRPGEPLPPKWALISLGITVASILIIAGALYWLFQAAALLDRSHWVVVGVLAVFALQALLFRTIRSRLPRQQAARLISMGGIVLCNTAIGAVGLYHVMELVKLAAGPALGPVVAVLLAAVAAGLMWYGARFPELELDDPNAPIIALPEVGPTVKSGLHFLLPILVLVWCLMVERLSPALSAFWATVLMIAILLTQRQLFALFRGNGQSMGDASRQGAGELFDGMVTGARNMIGIGIATATAGIVVGTVTLTGIGLVMSAFVEFLSGGNLIVMLLLVAVLSLILGMGLPTTANYIVVSSLMARGAADRGASVRVLFRHHGRRHAAGRPRQLRGGGGVRRRPDAHRIRGVLLFAQNRGAAVPVHLQHRSDPVRGRQRSGGGHRVRDRDHCHADLRGGDPGILHRPVEAVGIGAAAADRLHHLPARILDGHDVPADRGQAGQRDLPAGRGKTAGRRVAGGAGRRGFRHLQDRHPDRAAADRRQRHRRGAAGGGRADPARGAGRAPAGRPDRLRQRGRGSGPAMGFRGQVGAGRQRRAADPADVDPGLPAARDRDPDPAPPAGHRRKPGRRDVSLRRHAMYKDILLPIDLNHESSWSKALPCALALAKAFGARLHVMTVVPDFGMSIVGSYFPKGFEKTALEGANAALHEFTAKHLPKGVDCQHIVRHGTVYEEILDAAKAVEADLIVMGSHRPELKDYLLGPNAARVVRHADRSVMVVRA